LLSGLGPLLDDREHQFLLAHAAGVLDFEGLGLLEQFRDVQSLEFVEMHEQPAWNAAGTGPMEMGRKRGPGLEGGVEDVAVVSQRAP